MTAPAATRWIYDFAEGSREMRELLGGKGANVAEMTRVLGPDRVPAGFTITTEACVAYMRAGESRPTASTRRSTRRSSASRATPAGGSAIRRSAARLGAQRRARLDAGHDGHRPQPRAQRRVGRGPRPRDRQRALRLGLLPPARADVRRRRLRRPGRRASRTRSPRSSASAGSASTPSSTPPRCASSRAASGALRLPAPTRASSCARRSSPCSTPGWATAPSRTAASTASRTTGAPPSTSSRWSSATAASTSASGVAFSRDEVTGAPEPSGDFLVDAQGEDVVSGVRTPRDLAELGGVDARGARRAARDPAHAGAPLQGHAGHRVHDRGRAPVHAPGAQRQAPRPRRGPLRRRRRRGRAAHPRRGDRRRSTPARSTRSCTPTFATDAAYEVVARGVAASPGAAKGGIVFTAEEAVAAAEAGRAVVLVRPFTEADDVAGFHAAKGILTSEGGKASHAALVARGMGRPAVTGAGEVHVDLHAQEVHIGDQVLRAGDLIAIDGTTGAVTLDDVPLVTPGAGRPLRDRPRAGPAS